MIKGELDVLDATLYPGDSAAIDHSSLTLHAGKDAEFLLFLLS